MVAWLPCARTAARAAAWGVALAAAAAVPATAGAWEASGALSAATDQVSRGLTLSAGHGVLMLDLGLHGTPDGSGGRWYAEAGGAVRTTGGSAERLVELRLAAGRHWVLNDDALLSGSVAHYRYGRQGLRPRYDADELGLRLDWRGRADAAATWSPNTYGLGRDGVPRDARAWSAELGWHPPLAGRWRLDLGAGWRSLQARPASYPYGSVGLSGGLGPVQAFVALIDSRAAQRGAAPAAVAGRRVVAALGWGF